MDIDNTMMVNKRNSALDMLKGISIIAVVLYHIGLLKSGYLGVDCFFVISGFLSMPRIVTGIVNGSFSYIKYIRGKLIRLLPSILLVSVISLAIGYVLWLPNDYENLSESVIASALFSNNILSGITTKNYWDSINEYKPLMHMWYLGILMEFYIFIPLVAMIIKAIAVKFKKNQTNTIMIGIGILSIVSFVLFLMPLFTAGDKFYFIPFRFWELSLGGVIGVYKNEILRFIKSFKLYLSFISLTFIITILCVGLINYDIAKIGVATTIIGGDTVASSNLIIPNTVLLISMVTVTCIFIVSSDHTSIFNNSKVLSALGKRSLSVFVWHQVILALYRYSISNVLSIRFIICFIILLAIFSELNYRFVEKSIKDSKKTIILNLIFALVLCGYSGIIYLRAGVVRDVPELGISTTNIKRNMHSKYCDRIYYFKDEFEDNGKLNILVVGNSFARDWGNILLESEYGDQINLYFSVHFNESLIDKIKKADRIFVFENYEDKVPNYVWDNADSDIVYCIGTKNFGITNGTIYSHRFSKDYYDQTVILDPGYKKLDLEKKSKWGDHYIELIEPVLIDGRVRVFSDERMLISQDCRHLTEAGAKYYAKILDFSLYMPC